jgi:hypothetical protein
MLAAGSKLVLGGGGLVGNGGMETQDCIRIERVQCSPAAIPIVGKLGMCSIARYPILLPLLDIRLGDVTIVFGVADSIERICDLAECFDADDAFER